VRQKVNESDKPQVIIINLKNNNEVIKRPINADSAIMHWSRNVIALKAQSRTIQIFDLQAKQKLKSALMSEDVVYWKWFSETSLGLVTDTSVWHWDVFDPNQPNPVKQFDRLPNLSVSSNPLQHRSIKRDVLTYEHRVAKSSITGSTMNRNGVSWSVSVNNRGALPGQCSYTPENEESLNSLKVTRPLLLPSE
jgi:hypothetical protein